MLRYLYADQLDHHPRLRAGMFADRAQQFSQRLGWEVEVDAEGNERDAYDEMNPLYILWERPDGTHGGSLRLLPTTAETMINDHFSHLNDGVTIRSPFIWECTRFCLAPGAEGFVSSMLMLGVLDVGLNAHLEHIAGVFDARMIRVYARVGWGPTVLGTEGEGRDAISAGLWPVEPRFRARLLSKAGISAELADHWYDRSFGARAERIAAVA